MNLVPALLALAVATTVVRPLLFAVALLAHKRWGVAVTTLERLLRACDYRVIQPPASQGNRRASHGITRTAPVSALTA